MRKIYENERELRYEEDQADMRVGRLWMALKMQKEPGIHSGFDGKPVEFLKDGRDAECRRAFAIIRAGEFELVKTHGGPKRREIQ